MQPTVQEIKGHHHQHKAVPEFVDKVHTQWLLWQKHGSCSTNMRGILAGLAT